MSALRTRLPLLLLLAFCFLPAYIWAQSLAGQGANNGTVLDPSGAVVANATVTVANPAIGVKRSITTSASGEFLASSLPPADGYVVSVSAAGFSVFEVKDISLHVGQVIAVPIRLAVAANAQSVSVTEVAEVLDPNRSGISTLVDQRRITDRSEERRVGK